jgi:hypothetical protein
MPDQDSLIYRSMVSGYMGSLDSVEINKIAREQAQLISDSSGSADEFADAVGSFMKAFIKRTCEHAAEQYLEDMASQYSDPREDEEEDPEDRWNRLYG